MFESTAEEKHRSNKKQDGSCDQLVNEAAEYSYLYKCDLLFTIKGTSHISVYSCTTSVHADSPLPKTLISYGARDWVQTSTSPDEISFWVQFTQQVFCFYWQCITLEMGNPRHVGQGKKRFLVLWIWTGEPLIGCRCRSKVGVVWRGQLCLCMLLSLHDGPFYKRTAEGVVTLKARAKPVAQWWKTNFKWTSWISKGYIFEETASAKFRGNPWRVLHPPGRAQSHQLETIINNHVRF